MGQDGRVAGEGETPTVETEISESDGQLQAGATSNGAPQSEVASEHVAFVARLIGWVSADGLFYVLGAMVGLVLGALAIFDAGTPGKVVAALLLLCVHACVPVYGRRIADRAVMSAEMRNQERRIAGRTSTLVFTMLLWIAVAISIDRWIARLPIAVWQKRTLLVGCVVVVVGVTWMEVRSFKSSRRAKDAPTSSTDEVAAATAGVSSGSDSPSADAPSISTSVRQTIARPFKWCWRMVFDDLPRFVISAAVGVIAVVLAVGVAGYVNQRDTDDDPIAVDPINIFKQDLDGINYVALGESYSAGEGLDSRIGGPEQHCHRSADAYPMILARALGGLSDRDEQPLTQLELLIPDRVHLDFRACSGAVSADIDLGLVGGWQAQIDAEPRPEVDLVTLTIGGNDVIFSDVVQACMLYDDCLQDTFVPRKLNRNQPTIDYPPNQDLDMWAPKAISRLRVNLARVYENVRLSYPNARVIVIGYPYLFHAESPWGSIPDLDCWTVMQRISQGERKGIRILTDGLNGAIVDLIRQHPQWRIEFVSTVAAWHKHEPCAGWGQYTNAVKPKLQLLSPVDGGSFHPNVKGHRQIARLLSCYLNRFPEPPVGPLASSIVGSAAPDRGTTEQQMSTDCSLLLAATGV